MATLYSQIFSDNGAVSKVPPLAPYLARSRAPGTLRGARNVDPRCDALGDGRLALASDIFTHRPLSQPAKDYLSIATGQMPKRVTGKASRIRQFSQREQPRTVTPGGEGGGLPRANAPPPNIVVHVPPQQNPVVNVAAPDLSPLERQLKELIAIQDAQRIQQDTALTRIMAHGNNQLGAVMEAANFAVNQQSAHHEAVQGRLADTNQQVIQHAQEALANAALNNQLSTNWLTSQAQQALREQESQWWQYLNQLHSQWKQDMHNQNETQARIAFQREQELLINFKERLLLLWHGFKEYEGQNDMEKRMLMWKHAQQMKRLMIGYREHAQGLIEGPLKNELDQVVNGVSEGIAQVENNPAYQGPTIQELDNQPEVTMLDWNGAPSGSRPNPFANPRVLQPGEQYTRAELGLAPIVDPSAFPDVEEVPIANAPPRINYGAVDATPAPEAAPVVPSRVETAHSMPVFTPGPQNMVMDSAPSPMEQQVVSYQPPAVNQQSNAVVPHAGPPIYAGGVIEEIDAGTLPMIEDIDPVMPSTEMVRYNPEQPIDLGVQQQPIFHRLKDQAVDKGVNVAANAAGKGVGKLTAKAKKLTKNNKIANSLIDKLSDTAMKGIEKGAEKLKVIGKKKGEQLVDQAGQKVANFLGLAVDKGKKRLRESGSNVREAGLRFIEPKRYLAKVDRKRFKAITA